MFYQHTLKNNCHKMTKLANEIQRENFGILNTGVWYRKVSVYLFQFRFIQIIF